MITKNWYKVASGLLIFESSTSNVYCRNMENVDSEVSANYKMFVLGLALAAETILTSIPTSTIARGVLFGTGDTPPTLEDYTLAGDAISTINSSSSITTIGSANDAEYAELSVTYTLTNTGTKDVTVKEVALVCFGCMMERTVLEAPITIPGGGVGQVTYTIRMNYPTA